MKTAIPATSTAAAMPPRRRALRVAFAHGLCALATLAMGGCERRKPYRPPTPVTDGAPETAPRGASAPR